MPFVVNDLSMAGQFHDMDTFRNAVTRIMMIRRRILEHGRSLSCHHGLTHARVAPDVVMQQAVNWLPINARRAWMQLLNRTADNSQGDGSEWLEVEGDIVTDSAIGDAAVRISHGLAHELVSFQPSTWVCNPIDVRWVQDDESSENISVPNHWELDSIQQALDSNPRPVRSWNDLATGSIDRCSRLTFSEDAFAPLEGHPFASSAADRIRVLLNTLDRLMGCVTEEGARNAEGQRLYQDHFTGSKSWFSDSSATEKNKFAAELTFRHPQDANRPLFCPWHGKVKTPQYRIHFAWPEATGDSLYIVYVGPKITKK